MHRNVDYSHLEGQAKIDAAVADVKKWMGQQWNVVEQMVKDQRTTYSYYTGCMEMLVGVSGYPLEAVWIHLGRELPKNEQK